jgi:hypothetical protein
MPGRAAVVELDWKRGRVKIVANFGVDRNLKLYNKQ